MSSGGGARGDRGVPASGAADGEQRSLDGVCRGELQLVQPRHGYRFNVDSVILAGFAEQVARAPRVVDLGAGCGVVGLLLARRWSDSSVVLVENQEELATLARENLRRNGLEERVSVIHGDLRRVTLWNEPPPQLVVANPPFRRRGSGLLSANRQIAQARHELTCTMEDLLGACVAGLPRGGEVVLIYPAERGEELRATMRRHRLGPLCQRLVCPRPRLPASRILVHGRLGAAASARELPALVIEDQPGRYSEEMRALLRDDS